MNYLIQKGNDSVSVLKIQQCLNLIQPDLNLKEDGIFNAKTQIKVIRFQNKCGLNPDGRIGILTWTKIIEHV